METKSRKGETKNWRVTKSWRVEKGVEGLRQRVGGDKELEGGEKE